MSAVFEKESVGVGGRTTAMVPGKIACWAVVGDADGSGKEDGLEEDKSERSERVRGV